MKQQKDSYSLLLLVIITAAFIFSADLATAGVDAWLDTNKINIGESVQLTIKSDRKTKAEPDIAPVKKDFDILGSSSSTSINLVNGSLSSSTTWYYTLSPQKRGKLIIPPINVDGEHTPELVLEVADAGTAPKDTGRNIFIETSCAPENPFIQQQVMCTVRLYSAQEITEGSLTDPEAGNAIIHRLGKDKSFNRIINSRRYRVIERKYAVFPQESGTMTITPPVFQGSILIPRARGGRDPFSSFLNRDPFFSHGLTGNTKQVRTTGSEVRLEVKPRPANFSGKDWLPASGLNLSQHWEPEKTEIQQGEPVTRTIIITAKGLTAEQLPDLTPDSIPGCSIYPDRAELKNSEHSTGITGRRVQKIAFIPEKPGSLTLPPVKLQWWNTVKNRPETAVLPGRKITVLPVPGQGQGQAGEMQDTISARTQRARPEEVTPATSVNKSAPVRPETVPAVAEGGHRNVWLWTSIFLGTAWFITLYFLFLEKKRRHTPENIGEDTSYAREKDSRAARKFRKEFRHACQRGDAWQAKRALIKWASATWPENPPAGLEDLARRFKNKEASKELKTLNSALYAGTEQAWDRGSKLAEIIRELPKDRHGRKLKTHPDRLPPLYPSEK